MKLKPWYQYRVEEQGYIASDVLVVGLMHCPNIAKRVKFFLFKCALLNRIRWQVEVNNWK